jgi:uncharacterized protein (DUF697 family)
MPTALQLAQGNAALTAAVLECRRLLHRRSLVSAAASAVPLPGLDWAVDAANLSRLIPQINARFGLTPEQIGQLPARKREHLQKTIHSVGSLLIGKTITRELILRVAQTIGVRLTTKQLAKYVPLAGTAVAALVGYSAVRYLGEQHLKECVQVVLSAKLALPPPTPDTHNTLETEH